MDFIKQLNYKDCKSVPKILSPEKLCPFDRTQYRKLYDPSRTKLMLRKMTESKVYGLKFWTLKEGTGNLGSDQFNTTFFALAKTYCPINVQILGNKHF